MIHVAGKSRLLKTLLSPRGNLKSYSEERSVTNASILLAKQSSYPGPTGSKRGIVTKPSDAVFARGELGKRLGRNGRRKCLVANHKRYIFWDFFKTEKETHEKRLKEQSKKKKAIMASEVHGSRSYENKKEVSRGPEVARASFNGRSSFDREKRRNFYGNKKRQLKGGHLGVYVTSNQSTSEPTSTATLKPTLKPTSKPTLKPTLKPTSKPTLKATSKPTLKPTLKPTPSSTSSTSNTTPLLSESENGVKINNKEKDNVPLEDATHLEKTKSAIKKASEEEKERRTNELELDILKVLAEIGIAGDEFEQKHPTQSNVEAQFVIKNCPFCHPIKNSSDQNKLGISILRNEKNNLPYAAYGCFRCGSKGSWPQFKKHFDVKESTKDKGIVATKASSDASGVAKPTKAQEVSEKVAGEVIQIWQSVRTKKPRFSEIVQEKRGISASTLEHYNVGFTLWNFPVFEEEEEEEGAGAGKKSASKNKKSRATAEKHNDSPAYRSRMVITFPYARLNVNQEKTPKRKSAKRTEDLDLPLFTAAKIRDLETKRNMRTWPTGVSLSLFGLETVPESAETVILTEGEYDAMAAYEGTGIPALSMPNGANASISRLKEPLERFRNIIIWMDNDSAGKTGIKKVIDVLGVSRCKVVTIPEKLKDKVKDANDALRHDQKILKKIVEDAVSADGWC